MLLSANGFASNIDPAPLDVVGVDGVAGCKPVTIEVDAIDLSIVAQGYGAVFAVDVLAKWALLQVVL